MREELRQDCLGVPESVGSSSGVRWFDEQLYAGLHESLSVLRILHVCKYFPPERGGMETYVRDLAQEQAAAGHKVRVLAHTAATSHRESMPEGYAVARSRVWMRAGDYVPVAPGLAWNLWRFLREEQPHILHVHCPNPAALWCVLASLGWNCGAGRGSDKTTPPPAARGAAATDATARRSSAEAENEAGTGRGESAASIVGDSKRWTTPRRPRLVVHWHSDVIFPQHRQPGALSLAVWRRMERALLGRADRIIATSQPYLESSEFLAPWRDKCVVAPLRLSAKRPEIPQGLRHEALDFLRGPVGGTTRAVLGVGRLAHYKGFEVLVRAVASAPSLRCCIMGDGEEGPALRALVQELGVQDRVLLPGEVGDDVLAACYEACDVFCLPSLLRTEAFGVVLLEALRAGKWCVVSNVPGSGMGTVIDHGVNGWLVPPGDVRELAQRLNNVRGDE